jgi:hypothetical protein
MDINGTQRPLSCDVAKKKKLILFLGKDCYLHVPFVRVVEVKVERLPDLAIATAS